ncbi:unnamed protein product, partial [Mesorhabditis belari]|uniref:Uncharacterized protein n=1 Tax=Mesorhabditis belari TaxID=2138241 RepID=A0AAF3FEX9_9BILA
MMKFFLLGLLLAAVVIAEYQFENEEGLNPNFFRFGRSYRGTGRTHHVGLTALRQLGSQRSFPTSSLN